MKPKRKVISEVRRRQDDVEMTTRDNRKIYVTGTATIAEMIAEGVSDFGISPIGSSKAPNYYYSDESKSP